MKSSTKEKAEGKVHQVKGKIKEPGGKAVGNKDLEAEGKEENLEGKVQEKVGNGTEGYISFIAPSCGGIRPAFIQP